MKRTAILLSLMFVFFINLGAQNTPQTPSQTDPFAEMDKQIEMLMKQWQSGGSMDSLLNNSFGEFNMIFDTTMLQSFFGDSNIQGMFQEFFPEDMSSRDFEKLMEQSMRMLESMDEEQMRSLLDAFDFSQIDEMMNGLDLKQLEGMMQGLNLKLPENYIDSLEQKREQNKKLKRI